jgi:hypothetical protein
LTEAAKEAPYLRDFLTEFNYHQFTPIPLYEDTTRAIALSNNPNQHKIDNYRLQDAELTMFLSVKCYPLIASSCEISSSNIIAAAAASSSLYSS